MEAELEFFSHIFARHRSAWSRCPCQGAEWKFKSNFGNSNIQMSEKHNPLRGNKHGLIDPDTFNVKLRGRVKILGVLL